METVYRSGEIRVGENVEETRKVQFIISDTTKDRHGTVLNMDGWELDNFNRNGIVGYQHDVYGGGMCSGPDPDTVIGKGRAWIERNAQRANGEIGTVLMGEVEFEPKEINPLAEKVFQKVLHGTLKATSVGFQAIGGGRLVNDETGEEKQMKEAPYQVPKGHTFYYDAQELLEYSVVNIPSNPGALKRDLRNQTANALHFLKRELGQDITYGEIEQMRVLDVVRMLETGGKPSAFSDQPSEEKEKESDQFESREDVVEVIDATDKDGPDKYLITRGELADIIKQRQKEKKESKEKELHQEEEATSEEGGSLKTLKLKSRQRGKKYAYGN